jgi:hypothetical protein
MKATGMLRETESDDNRGAFRKWAEAQLSGKIPPATRALPAAPDQGEDGE